MAPTPGLAGAAKVGTLRRQRPNHRCGVTNASIDSACGGGTEAVTSAAREMSSAFRAGALLRDDGFDTLAKRPVINDDLEP